MATHDVDQKLLGRLAKSHAAEYPIVSSALYRILGLSVLLARRLIVARSVRKYNASRENKSLALYHHIIWLAREGLALLETHVLPNASSDDQGRELRLFAYKLRASFYHVFCLFHNQPPVFQASLTPYASPKPGQSQVNSPLSPRQGNGQKRRSQQPTSSPKQSTGGEQENSPSPSQTHKATLREPIPSMISDASYVTNPYAAVSPPPGLPQLMPISDPTNFLLPARNYVAITDECFKFAARSAEQLSGSNPLRVSIALEYCAFLWDCMRQHNDSRRLARKTIREVYRAPEGMNDEEFDDSAILVGTLGRMMRRKSQEGTPRFGEATPPPPGPTTRGNTANTSRQMQQNPGVQSTPYPIEPTTPIAPTLPGMASSPRSGHGTSGHLRTPPGASRRSPRT